MTEITLSPVEYQVTIASGIKGDPGNDATLSEGWFDIEPSKTISDGNWQLSVLSNGMGVERAVGSGGAKRLYLSYHVPHHIKLGQLDGEVFFHIHGFCEDQDPGTIRILATIYAAKANEVYSDPFELEYIITPAERALLTNHIFELPLPTGLAEYLVPDTIFCVTITREPTHESDTNTGAFYFETADFHVQSDSRFTTSRDLGTGWEKA